MGQKLFKDSRVLFALTYVVFFCLNIFLPVFYNGQPFNQGVVISALISCLIGGTFFNLVYYIANFIRLNN